MLRDFQKINYSCCGAGILARLRLEQARMPAPQKNFGDFFIWKSLSAERRQFILETLRRDGKVLSFQISVELGRKILLPD